MFFIAFLFTFGVGVFNTETSMVLASGLFAIASSIEQAVYKYFKYKN